MKSDKKRSISASRPARSQSRQKISKQSKQVNNILQEEVKRNLIAQRQSPQAELPAAIQIGRNEDISKATIKGRSQKQTVTFSGHKQNDQIKFQNQAPQNSPTKKTHLKGRSKKRQASSSAKLQPQRSQRLIGLLSRVQELQSMIQKLPDTKERHFVGQYLKIGEASRFNLGGPYPTSSADQSRRQIQTHAQLLLQQLQEEPGSDYKMGNFCKIYESIESGETSVNYDALGTFNPQVRILDSTDSIRAGNSAQRNFVGIQSITNSSMQQCSKCVANDCKHVQTTQTSRVNENQAPVKIVDLKEETLNLDSQTHTSCLNQISNRIQPEQVQNWQILGSQPQIDVNKEKMLQKSAISCSCCGKAIVGKQLQQIRAQTSKIPSNAPTAILCESYPSQSLPKDRTQSADSKQNAKDSNATTLKDVTKRRAQRRKNSRQNEDGWKQEREMGKLNVISQHQSQMELIGRKTDSAMYQRAGLDQLFRSDAQILPRLSNQHHMSDQESSKKLVTGNVPGEQFYEREQSSEVNVGSRKGSYSKIGPLKATNTTQSKRVTTAVPRMSQNRYVCNQCVIPKNYVQSRGRLRIFTGSGATDEVKETLHRFKDGDYQNDQNQGTTPYEEIVDYTANGQTESRINMHSLTGTHLSQEQSAALRSTLTPSTTQANHELAVEQSFNVLLSQQNYQNLPVDSDQSMTEKTDKLSRNIRDSFEFTSYTQTANQPQILDEMSQFEQDELSVALINELKEIARGNFDMSVRLSQIFKSAKQLHPDLAFEMQSSIHEISQENMSSIVGKTSDGRQQVRPDLAAQSNIATYQEIESNHESSAIYHSEVGIVDKNQKQVESNKTFPHRSNVSDPECAFQANHEESLSEQSEEESEEEMSEKREVSLDEKYGPMADLSLTKKGSNDDAISRRTSFSEFYVIDGAEEQRLKQIAFERYMEDKEKENKLTKNSKNAVQSQSHSKDQIQNNSKITEKEVDIGEKMLVIQNEFKNLNSVPSNQKVQETSKFDNYKITKETNRNGTFISKQTDITQKAYGHQKLYEENRPKLESPLISTQQDQIFDGRNVTSIGSLPQVGSSQIIDSQVQSKQTLQESNQSKSTIMDLNLLRAQGDIQENLTISQNSSVKNDAKLSEVERLSFVRLFGDKKQTKQELNRLQDNPRDSFVQDYFIKDSQPNQSDQNLQESSSQVILEQKDQNTTDLKLCKECKSQQASQNILEGSKSISEQNSKIFGSQKEFLTKIQSRQDAKEEDKQISVLDQKSTSHDINNFQNLTSGMITKPLKDEQFTSINDSKNQDHQRLSPIEDNCDEQEPLQPNIQDMNLKNSQDGNSLKQIGEDLENKQKESDYADPMENQKFQRNEFARFTDSKETAFQSKDGVKPWSVSDVQKTDRKFIISGLENQKEKMNDTEAQKETVIESNEPFVTPGVNKIDKITFEKSQNNLKDNSQKSIDADSISKTKDSKDQNRAQERMVQKCKSDIKIRSSKSQITKQAIKNANFRQSREGDLQQPILVQNQSLQSQNRSQMRYDQAQNQSIVVNETQNGLLQLKPVHLTSALKKKGAPMNIYESPRNESAKPRVRKQSRLKAQNTRAGVKSHLDRSTSRDNIRQAASQQKNAPAHWTANIEQTLKSVLQKSGIKRLKEIKVDFDKAFAQNELSHVQMAHQEMQQRQQRVVSAERQGTSLDDNFIQLKSAFQRELSNDQSSIYGQEENQDQILAQSNSKIRPKQITFVEEYGRNSLPQDTSQPLTLYDLMPIQQDASYNTFKQSKTPIKLDQADKTIWKVVRQVGQEGSSSYLAEPILLNKTQQSASESHQSKFSEQYRQFKQKQMWSDNEESYREIQTQVKFKNTSLENVQVMPSIVKRNQKESRILIEQTYDGDVESGAERGALSGSRKVSQRDISYEQKQKLDKYASNLWRTNEFTPSVTQIFHKGDLLSRPNNYAGSNLMKLTDKSMNAIQQKSKLATLNADGRSLERVDQRKTTMVLSASKKSQAINMNNLGKSYGKGSLSNKKQKSYSRIHFYPQNPTLSLQGSSQKSQLSTGQMRVNNKTAQRKVVFDQGMSSDNQKINNTAYL